MKSVITTFAPTGGKHCITTSLKQIFSFYGYPLSEEMIFGLGEGLDFTYINLASSPMVSGRSRILDFEKTLSTRLGVTIRIKQSKNYDRAFITARRMIGSNQPVLIYVDMPYLDYLGLDDNSHFGGHSVVLFGYDDEKEVFYISDRDNSDYPIRTPKGQIGEDYHLVPYEQIQFARSSNLKPFPANNKYAEFDFSGYQGVGKAALLTSIKNVCEKMLNPPANLKGINGILKFSKEIKKWSKFDNEKLKRAGITNYFMINADGGTGGGIFREMYGVFLTETARVLENNSIVNIGKQFIDLSKQWDSVAAVMWTLFETGQSELLNSMSEVIKSISEHETILFTSLQNVLRTK